MIVVFHKLIINGLRSFASLYNCLLTIVSNTSPYIKQMSLQGSLKLVALFEVFASKKFLLAGAGNYQFTFFLIDIFNNIIQYQYEGNHHLVYALVRRKHVIDALLALQVPPGTSSSGQAAAKDDAPAQFVPDQAWLEAWKSRLPLDPILKLIKYLKPQIEDLCRRNRGMVNDSIVSDFLKHTTMVSLSPLSWLDISILPR